MLGTRNWRTCGREWVVGMTVAVLLSSRGDPARTPGRWRRDSYGLRGGPIRQFVHVVTVQRAIFVI